ncbi:MAG TPA: S8 family serine peptidase [Actinophytocola sp.]|uniref:S8 family serine peptidase n=1 Tax=Actinophytocola sp. TaxID=1872138 RepID=UPI002DDDAF7C|nr:S8 family serine peptidase [Actinophytocola sp.]HEV2782809.1 S8 family serine peptidase [Actinophytocola sp.]
MLFKLKTAVVVMALVTPVLGGSAAAAPVAGGVAAGGTVVTLITGDRVRLLGRPGGEPVFGIEPAPGRENIGFVRESRIDGELTVVPADAVGLVEQGRLDPRLFNVSALVRHGYTDAGPKLPLIVSYRHSGPAAATAATTVRELPSINGVAVARDGARAGEFWRWLTGSPDVAKVWLDGVATPRLDVSVPQIGAPVAWQRGLTGAGVTVGVLDSGIKADHPDLIGKVVEARDFTGTRPDAGDDIGHGTHVAGIIAGTGAASGGRYRGVAPDAKLVSGKVCVSFGCPESAVIAGMEWIAPRVRVVNMSLGGESTDGTDPMSQAVNNLTARFGTLFVAAGSNDRSIDLPDPTNSVSSPAVADAALAVGSVSAQDATSPFSGPGPRIGDHAVKPDIAGPGESIVSARAPGTPAGDQSPVDANYTALSGTSMAAPHVAGAAAILLQQHPDWPAGRLKPALMSTARPTAGVFEQGAGRVDVARAVTQNVTATGGSVNFGFLAWPQNGPVTRTVGYRNDGSSAVTLRLAADGVFTAPSRVVVPAHGTAEVAVSVDPAGGATGLQGGRLTATAGDVAVQTALSAFIEPESYNLTVRLISRAERSSSVVRAVNAETGQAYGIRGGLARLPKGRYDINALDVAPDSSATMLSIPNLTLGADATVTLDARAGRPVTATVDRANARFQVGELNLFSAPASGDRSSSLSYVAPQDARLYAVPTAGEVTDHTYAFSFRATLGPVTPETGAGDFVYQLAFFERGRIPADTAYRPRDRDLARVDTVYHGQGAPGTALRADYARFPIPAGVGIYATAYQYSLPAGRIELYTANPDVTWEHLLSVTDAELSDAETYVSRRSYRPGGYRAGWNRAPLSPAFGEAQDGFGVFRDGTTLQFAVSTLSGSDPNQVTFPPTGLTGTTTLLRNGTEIGTSPVPGVGVFTVPDASGTYTVRVSADRAVPWSVVATHADVEWTFRDTVDPGTPLPVLVVRTIGAVDAQSRAPAGRPFPLLLKAQHQPGQPAVRLAALRVEASYDDGRTWTVAPVVSGGDTGLAVLRHPATPGFVSLRVGARDVDGNSVSQTVIRAYQTTRG